MKRVRSNWSGALLVCGKCSRKLDGGFGPEGKASLGKVLRRSAGLGKGRKAALGVAEIGCLGLCPKNGVVLIDTGRPDLWRVVPAGADPAAILDDLARTDPSRAADPESLPVGRDIG